MDYDYSKLGGAGTQGIVSSGTIARSAVPGSPPIKTTQPDELLRHNISDEDLEMLKDTNRDGLEGAFWGCFGAALASLPPSCESLLKAYIESPSTPLTIVHLAEIIIFIATAAISIALYIVSNSRSKRATTLVEKIRARTALPT
jgi:hypothetical protein